MNTNRKEAEREANIAFICKQLPGNRAKAHTDTDWPRNFDF